MIFYSSSLTQWTWNSPFKAILPGKLMCLQKNLVKYVYYRFCSLYRKSWNFQSMKKRVHDTCMYDGNACVHVFTQRAFTRYQQRSHRKWRKECMGKYSFHLFPLYVLDENCALNTSSICVWVRIFSFILSTFTHDDDDDDVHIYFIHKYSKALPCTHSKSMSLAAKNFF